MSPGRERAGAIALLAAVVCLCAPAAVRAQGEAEKKAQAKDLYERATRLYDVGKYGEAIDAYEQAYLLVEDPALLYNIGQAYRLWDHPEEAIRSYKNYLRKRPQASNRADVERKIADLERTVEERRRGQGAAEPPAAPGPAPAGAYPAAPVAPTEPAPVYSPGTAPPPVPAAGPPTVAEPAQAPAEGPKHNWLGYGLVAGGGALLLVAVVAAAAGQQDANKLRDAANNGQAFDPTVEKNGKAANAVAYIGLATGIVAGGVGAYLLWRGRGHGASAALVPTVSPSYAGGSALVSF